MSVKPVTISQTMRDLRFGFGPDPTYGGFHVTVELSREIGNEDWREEAKITWASDGGRNAVEFREHLGNAIEFAKRLEEIGKDSNSGEYGIEHVNFHSLDEVTIQWEDEPVPEDMKWDEVHGGWVDKNTDDVR